MFITGLTNGGPAGALYEYLVAWVGFISVNAVLGELASMAPTSGAQYHWVSILAPRSSRKFLGYITGWLMLAGWQAMTASAAYLCGTMIQGALVLTHPDYLNHWQNWHGTLLLWAVILLSVTVNTVWGPLLARFEGAVLVLHVLGFFAILLPLVLLSDHSNPGAVWTTFLNQGGWPTQGLSFCIGIQGSVFAFLGGDGAIHMSEEIRNPSMIVPRSLLAGLLINGILGFAMLIALLYCMGDVDQALEANPSYPFMAIFKSSVGSTAGATVMVSIIIIMAFAATTGCLASTSRIYWAFARDHALPGSQYLKKLDSRTHVPMTAVVTTTILSCLLALVNIGDATAFNGVISITVAGVMGSYLIVACLILYRRLTTGIRPRNDDNTLTNTTGAGLTWGPWRLKGFIGIANNTFACAFLAFTFFFSFWPAVADVTPASMNWAVLVTVIVLGFSIAYYALVARKTFSGPIVEVE
ncbi:hypothetical protein VSDG_04886 [Cytospora chrysosperma]|uniref:Amino acid permease/ SLC12A domain-containing protein n=1 Tax=Cytospora chrysosperma TaxID=252740 RepID=A0A423W3H4_CYTCH|nr:hypothetical protein VSDG_04886 [Valsa sordida]